MKSSRTSGVARRAEAKISSSSKSFISGFSVVIFIPQFSFTAGQKRGQRSFTTRCQAFDGLNADVHDLGDLGISEPVEVTQCDRLGLPFGKLGQSLLKRLVSCSILHLFCDRRSPAFGFGNRVDAHASFAPAKTIGAEVRCHAIEPCRNLRLVLPPLGGDAPKADQRLLGDVFGLGLIPEHTIRLSQCARCKPSRQNARSISISVGISNEERSIGNFSVLQGS